MAERPEFQTRQFAFAAYIRDPENAALPEGADPRRMAVYRDLFFNNLRNLLATTFPVLRRVLGDTGWRHLVRAFMKEHRARTPYFPQLPREFVDFLESGPVVGADEFPFLAELAQHEYAELEVALCAGIDDPDAVDPGGDLLAGIPVACAASCVHSYRWPVHRIAADHVPTGPAAEPVHLAVFRGADDKVRFAELNAVTAALYARVRDNPANLSGRRLLEGLAREVGYADAEMFVGHGARMFDEMLGLGLIAGTVRDRV